MKKTKQKVLASSLFPGALLLHENEYYLVDKSEIVSGSGSVTAIVCDIENGMAHVFDFGVRSKVEIVDYQEKKVEYWHKSEEPNDNQEIFFDINTLEEVKIPEELCEKKRGYIKNSVVYDLLIVNSEIIGIVLPRFMEVEVRAVLQQPEEVEVTQDNDKNSLISVELETGITIKVPSYIERSDIIKVDTRKQKFVQRF